MSTEVSKSHEYKPLLPFNKERQVVNQFGFTPRSILRPSKEERIGLEKDAYLDDDILDERKGYGIRDENGFSKMSEFHCGLAYDIYSYWSLEGSRVVDPFAGRVTRAVIASKTNRQYFGYEISPSTYERSLTHFTKLNISPTLYLADGVKLEHSEDNFADLVFTCPPYFNIEKYESVDNQLSDITDYNYFKVLIDLCAFNCHRVLKRGGFCVWVVADFRKNCELIPYHIDVTNSFVKAGFINHDIIIVENFSPMASWTLEKCAAKRYMPKVHEYVLVFRKDGNYVVPDYCKIPKKKKKDVHFS